MAKKIKPEEEQGGTVVLDEPSESTTATVAVLNPTDRITIKKAYIKKDLFLSVEYSEKLKDGDNNVKKECEAPIHNDLKAAFRKLDEHLCRISEQYNSQGDMDGFNCNCKGFTISGSGDSEGVTLTGYRGLENGKYLNLNTPFTKWADDYQYMSELGQIIEECKHEVKQYLFEGKHAPEAQQSFEFPEEGEGDDVDMDDL